MNNDWRGNFPREDSLLRNDCSGSRIENELPSSWAAAEVKHVVQRARNRIRRAVSDPAEVPIVFDEPQNRGLICYGIVDEVCFAQGEITSSGNRGPKPQRPFCVPPLTSFTFGEPQLPGPSNWSSETFDWVTMVPIWWSYQPSESSQAITTAVSFHSGLCIRALIVSTTKICSSIGSE